MAKLLLVEDEEMIRSLLAEVFSSWGHEVETARNGVEGLEKFEPQKFDAIITDNKMPGMTGTEMIAKVRQMDKDIPIAISSSEPIPEQELEGSANISIITKTLGWAEMSKAFRRFLLQL